MPNCRWGWRGRFRLPAVAVAVGGTADVDNSGKPDEETALRPGCPRPAPPGSRPSALLLCTCFSEEEDDDNYQI